MFGDVLDGEARLPEDPGGAARGKQLNSSRRQSAGKRDEAGFVRNRKEGTDDFRHSRRGEASGAELLAVNGELFTGHGFSGWLWVTTVMRFNPASRQPMIRHATACNHSRCRGFSQMNRVAQIEAELEKMSPVELRMIREWLAGILQDQREFTPEFETAIQESEQEMAAGVRPRDVLMTCPFLDTVPSLVLSLA